MNTNTVAPAPMKLNFKQFVELWWNGPGESLNEALAGNGQFDDFPYEIWKEAFADVLPTDKYGFFDPEFVVEVPNIQELMHL